MIGDHQGVGLKLDRVASIVRVQDAFNDDLALPAIADPFEVFPADAGIEIRAKPVDIVS